MAAIFARIIPRRWPLEQYCNISRIILHTFFTCFKHYFFIQGLKYVIFALYDGHGGNGVSLKLAKELHLVIHQVLYQ
jgi:hypothetical protein